MFSYSFDATEDEPEQATPLSVDITEDETQQATQPDQATLDKLLTNTTAFLLSRILNDTRFTLAETRRLQTAEYLLQGLELQIANVEFDADTSMDLTYAGDMLYTFVSDDLEELSTSDVSETISNLSEEELQEYVEDYVNSIDSSVTETVQSVSTSEASLQPSQTPTDSPVFCCIPTISWEGGDDDEPSSGVPLMPQKVAFVTMLMSFGVFLFNILGFQ